MISKSKIAAIVLVAMGLSSPAFAQMPPPNYYGYYPGAYAYPYEQPGPYGWGPYGYGGWYNSAASIDYNIHTPPNH